MDFKDFIQVIIALICSALIAFTLTPVVRVFAYKIGAVDVPKDSRRMHRITMPLLGGLAIFCAFVITTLAFCDISKSIIGLLAGTLVIVLAGILDDKFSLNPLVKLALQFMAAGIIVCFGITIDSVNLFGKTVELGNMTYPITILWILAMTNAVNLIDGLDGLSCGVSAISGLSILISSFFMPSTPMFAVILNAALTGACLGFLPFNFNPAKIFMGDTGSMFLGFSLSVISILGVFKASAVFAFWLPFISFALPLFDTFFAFTRRILKGRNPFSADRGHIHHRLIDLGFNQKQSVTVLYSISAILGISSIMFALERPLGGVIIIFSALLILVVNWLLITKNDETREETGLGLSALAPKVHGNDEAIANTRSDRANVEQLNNQPEEE